MHAVTVSCLIVAQALRKHDNPVDNHRYDTAKERINLQLAQAKWPLPTNLARSLGNTMGFTQKASRTWYMANAATHLARNSIRGCGLPHVRGIMGKNASGVFQACIMLSPA